MEQRREEQQGNAVPLIGGGALAGIAFVALRLGLAVTFFWSFVAGVGAFIVGASLFQIRRRPRKQSYQLYGITKEDLENALSVGRAKLAELKRAVYAITDTTVRAKGEEIVHVTDRILKDIEQDPKDLRQARQFLNYYLDTTIKIVSRYVSLSRESVLSAEARETLAKVESSLETIRRAFEKQLAKLMEDDVMDLDTEIEVLERTIKMEGLGDQ